MPKKDFSGDKKYYRILKILNLLNENGKVRISDLTAEFDVSARSIQRDIERVNMTFGLQQSGKGEYSFAGGVSLRDMRLSEEQLSALILMREIFKSMGGALSRSFDSLFRRMTRLSPWESPYAVIMPKPRKDFDPANAITAVETAILEHRKIRVGYMKKNALTDRLLSPIKILVDNGFYYILSMSDKKGAYVKYRLDNLRSIELTGYTFTPPSDIGKMIRDATSIWGAMPARERKILMRLRIAPAAADFFRKKDFFPMQKLVKEGADGSVILESRLAQFMEAIPTILNWIPDIEVMHPPALKTEIRSRVEQYLKNISGPAPGGNLRSEQHTGQRHGGKQR